MIKDAKRAGEIAKDYFITVHGWMSVSDFEATEISHIEQQGQWLVKCAFYMTIFPAPFVPKVKYELRINEDERVVSVKKLDDQK